MNQLINWLNMGGYYNYVWCSYGIVLAVLGLNIIAARKYQKNIKKKLYKWFKTQ